MKVDDVQKLLEIQLISQIIKSTSSDDNSDSSFSTLMESMLNAIVNKNGNLNLNSLVSGNNGTLNAIKNSINTNVTSGNLTIDEAVDKASKEYNVDKKLILAVIQQESSFDPNSVSSAGAEGLMQLMPETAKELGVNNAFNIEQNVEGGTKYLKNLLDMYGNSKEMALAAYNAGPGAVNSRGVRNASDIYKMSSETKDYVQKVMSNYNKLG